MKRYMVRIDYSPKENHPSFDEQNDMTYLYGVGQKGLVAIEEDGSAIASCVSTEWYAREYGYKRRGDAERAVKRDQHDEKYWYAKYSVMEFDV